MGIGVVEEDAVALPDQLLLCGVFGDGDDGAAVAVTQLGSGPLGIEFSRGLPGRLGIS